MAKKKSKRRLDGTVYPAKEKTTERFNGLKIIEQLSSFFKDREGRLDSAISLLRDKKTALNCETAVKEVTEALIYSEDLSEVADWMTRVAYYGEGSLAKGDVLVSILLNRFPALEIKKSIDYNKISYLNDLFTDYDKEEDIKDLLKKEIADHELKIAALRNIYHNITYSDIDLSTELKR